MNNKPTTNVNKHNTNTHTQHTLPTFRIFLLPKIIKIHKQKQKYSPDVFELQKKQHKTTCIHIEKHQIKT